MTFADFSETTLARGSVVVHLAGKAHDVAGTSDAAEYHTVNYGLTRSVYSAFLRSDASRFIFASSVKAVTDHPRDIVDEDTPALPLTAYGRSKLMAEEFLRAHPCGREQRVYVLRPCAVYGAGVVGNIRLLVRLVQSGLPVPLAAYSNKRSVLSVDNLAFVIESLLDGDVETGTYNVADDEPISSVELVGMLGQALARSPHCWKVSPSIMTLLARLGDVVGLPLTSERLAKLTENYVVSNASLKAALGIERMPLTTAEGVSRTVR